MKGKTKMNAIEVKNLTVSYGSYVALENINLTVKEGEYLGIMGPNGGGKSTLLKSILGLVPKKNGEIKLFGEDIKKNRQCIGYVPQHTSVDKSFPISVQEAVMCAFLKGGLHPFFTFGGAKRKMADEKLEKVGLEDLKNRQLCELSGGEVQRLLIARALASEPSVLLLAEPAASVDPASREKIYSLLAELNKSITIVMVTHDMAAVASEVKRLACLNRTLVYHGAPQLDEGVVKELYGCPVDLIAHGLPHRVLKNHEGSDGCC